MRNKFVSEPVISDLKCYHGKSIISAHKRETLCHNCFIHTSSTTKRDSLVQVDKKCLFLQIVFAFANYTIIYWRLYGYFLGFKNSLFPQIFTKNKTYSRKCCSSVKYQWKNKSPNPSGPETDYKLLVTGAPVIQSLSVQFSSSVVSDSLQPHRLWYARPPCLSTSPRV